MTKCSVNGSILFTPAGGTMVSESWCFYSPGSRRLNVGCGPAEERVLLTGLHAVADIYCENCKTTLGWKYVSMVFLKGI